MRKMKDSGIEWFGEIPDDWSIPMVKRLFSIGRGRVIATTELKDSGYPVYSSQTKDNGVLGYIDTYDFDRSQLTWTTDGANAGTVFLRKGKHNCTNVCGTLMPKNDENSLEFLKYMVAFTALYHKRADINGFKIMNNEMADIHILIPPYLEQLCISSFLDSKCSEIDKAVEKTKESIEEYKKLKQSIITQAVTKGVRGERKMKDSGIEWIGEIPEEWECKKAKYCILISNGSDPKTDGDIPVYGSGASSFKSCGEYKEGPTVLIGRKGATLHIPHYIEGRYWNVDTAFDVKVQDLFDLKYYYYCACSFDYKLYISQTTLPGMTQTNYENMFLPSPSIEEQEEIVAYLDSKSIEIDNIISKKERFVTELETYKKSLIYEYVTGKKEVPASWQK